MEKRHINLVGPTFLITIGAILLLNNLGVLDWTVWDMLRLWPILLIGAGLEMLIDYRSIWGTLVAAAIVVALIAGGIWITEGSLPSATSGETVGISYERGNATSAAIQLEPTISHLTIESLVDSTSLIEGSIQTNRNTELHQDFTEDDPAEVLLSSNNPRRHSYITAGRAATWQLQVNSDVQLDLSIDMGIGDATLDLSELALERAQLDLGIGRADVALPLQNDASVVIDSGIGTVIVRVPESVGARITLDGGIVGRNLPPSYVQNGNTYTSPKYDQADNKVDVVIGLGIGNIRVVPMDKG